VEPPRYLHLPRATLQRSRRGVGTLKKHVVWCAEAELAVEAVRIGRVQESAEP